MIEKIPTSSRSNAEQELLEELSALDELVGPVMTKPGTMPDYMFKIISGPSGACPCCGRKDKDDADRFIPRIP